MKNKTINSIRHFVSKNRHSTSPTALLSSCALWVTLMVSGLLLIQTTSLKAMEEGEAKRKRSASPNQAEPPQKIRKPSPVSSFSSKKSEPNWKEQENNPSANPGKRQRSDPTSDPNKRQRIDASVYEKDSELPLTPESWKNHGLSDRLKKLIAYIEINSIQTIQENLEKCKQILLCEDVVELRNPQKVNKGYSGANVEIGDYNGVKVAIKKFEKIDDGLKELLFSLIALKNNPDPQNLKMARIYDAYTDPEQGLCIVMEHARGKDIYDFLETNFAENAVKACAQYLAKFHLATGHRPHEDTSKQRYIIHASKPCHALIKNSLEEENEKIPLLSLKVGEKDPFLKENITSETIIRVLDRDKQGQFKNFVEKARNLFKENSGEIFRANTPYFLTTTHGDAHGNNLFYDNSESDVSTDSFKRIAMIDFASIVETYGDIGDPAEDIGRFLGFLWKWAAQRICNTGLEDLCSDKRISALQSQFMDTYLNEIKENGFFTEKNQKLFEKVFKENCNFYKLRYYRAIFNSSIEKEKDDVKIKILESWIKENIEREKEDSHFVASSQENMNPDPMDVDVKTISHFLPDRMNKSEFVESAEKEEGESYLTMLENKLNSTGTATLSSSATIVGEGGIGKTTLALEYAHRALKKNKYDLIYWVPSANVLSLLKEYRDLLKVLGVDASIIKKADDTKVIQLVKKHVGKKEKCLLIYDNVQDADFLKLYLPEKAHILITSRMNEGWGENSISLNVFRPEDSIRYFFNITGLARTEENEEIARTLAKHLDHLPLALAHAAHYIKLVGGAHVTKEHFKEYLEGFKQLPDAAYFEKKINPLEQKESKITHENLIAKTFRMAENYIAKEEKQSIASLAQKLIGYCAYLDPDAISEEIFLEENNNSEAELDSALKLLSSLSLIKRAGIKTSFSMHRLEQLVVRTKKEKNQEHQEIFSHIVPAFNRLFENNISTDEQIKKLCNNLPHILKLLTYSQKLNIFSEDSEVLLNLEGVGKILHFLQTSFTLQGLALENDEELLKFFEKQSFFFKCVRIRNDMPNWLIQSAEQSHPKIQMALYKMYMIAFLVRQDKEKAFFWCSKAADQQDVEAQYCLGHMYKKGDGVAQDDNKAAEWFRNSAKQENADFFWCSKAADQQNVEAQYWLGHMYKDGNGVSKDYSKAAEWFRKAAKQENANAQFFLGFMYMKGNGVPQDDKEAIKWFQKAAKQENAYGQSFLGLMYELGRGIPQNDNKAVEWYQKAADQGQVDAQVSLGWMCAHGRGVPRNDKEAITWYQKAAVQGNATAENCLGWMYAHGRGVPQDDKEAIKWFQKAADQGDTQAQANLRWMNANGRGMKQNEEQGGGWLQKATNAASRISIKFLEMSRAAFAGNFSLEK